MKRAKRRYLALELDAEFAPAERDFMDAVWGSVTRLYGEIGASQAGLSLISYSAESKSAVLRVNLPCLNIGRVGLASIMSLAGKPAAVHVVAISGTIKSLRER
jgi:RNase P/RNase MRP subunit POP5